MLTGDYWNNVSYTVLVNVIIWVVVSQFYLTLWIEWKHIGKNLELGDGRKMHINGNKDIYKYNIELLKIKMADNILRYRNYFQSPRLFWLYSLL